MNGRIFLANVGVNASHRLVSPLRENGSFTLVTIPEDGALRADTLVRYGDVAAFRACVPERFWSLPTHCDPEFETLTYGDNCGRAARAAALKQCLPGDVICFIARLVGPGGPIFALVGLLEVEQVLQDVRAQPDDCAMARFGANAHIRRAMADGRYWDGFWVFAGTERSGLLPRAVPIGRPEATLLFRTSARTPWEWPAGRSALQTIGSYTRTCRCIIDPATDPKRFDIFWQLVGSAAPAMRLPAASNEARRR